MHWQKSFFDRNTAPRILSKLYDGHGVGEYVCSIDWHVYWHLNLDLLVGYKFNKQQPILSQCIPLLRRFCPKGQVFMHLKPYAMPGAYWPCPVKNITLAVANLKIEWAFCNFSGPLINGPVTAPINAHPPPRHIRVSPGAIPARDLSPHCNFSPFASSVMSCFLF